MAEAGALSEEIVLNKAIAAQKERMQSILKPAERKSAMAELAQLELRKAIAEEARKAFLRP